MGIMILSDNGMEELSLLGFYGVLSCLEKNLGISFSGGTQNGLIVADAKVNLGEPMVVRLAYVGSSAYCTVTSLKSGFVSYRATYNSNFVDGILGYMKSLMSRGF